MTPLGHSRPEEPHEAHPALPHLRASAHLGAESQPRPARAHKPSPAEVAVWEAARCPAESLTTARVDSIRRAPRQRTIPRPTHTMTACAVLTTVGLPTQRTESSESVPWLYAHSDWNFVMHVFFTLDRLSIPDGTTNPSFGPYQWLVSDVTVTQ